MAPERRQPSHASTNQINAGSQRPLSTQTRHRTVSHDVTVICVLCALWSVGADSAFWLSTLWDAKAKKEEIAVDRVDAQGTTDDAEARTANGSRNEKTEEFPLSAFQFPLTFFDVSRKNISFVHCSLRPWGSSMPPANRPRTPIFTVEWGRWTYTLYSMHVELYRGESRWSRYPQMSGEHCFSCAAGCACAW
jgi:hypothetical protein